MAKKKPSWLETFWEEKKMYVIGAAALMVLTTIGALASRVRTYSKQMTAQQVEFSELKQAYKQKEALVTKLEQSTKKSESKYKKLVAAINPLTGEPLFDKDGNPIFNSEDGESSAVEELISQVDSLQRENESLQDSIQRKEFLIRELSEKKSGPSFKAWNGGVRFETPLLSPLDYMAGSWSVGGGPNFLLGPLTLMPALGVGGPLQGLSKDNAKASLDLRTLF